LRAHRLIVGADQRREVTYRTKVGLDQTALALKTRLLDLQIGEGLSLDRRLVSKAVALRLPTFVVCGAELGDRRPAGRPSRFFWAYAKRPPRQRGCGNWCHC
jgi:hypothetical protein